MVNKLSFDWTKIALVVFDVDGTLYRQGPLRLRMGCELALDGINRLNFDAIRIVSKYRKLREDMPAGIPRFEESLRKSVAQACGCTVNQITEFLETWLERRPLRHVPNYLYPGTRELFSALRRAEKIVGVWSDYPAQDKLTAMSLQADHIVHAADPMIDALKPDTKGLAALMERAGASPASTLLIGDRIDRDGAAARKAGTHFILRTSKARPDWTCVSDFMDPIFSPVLNGEV